MNADDDRKCWATVRARCARHGVMALRSDPADGRCCFFAVAAGQIRMLPSMTAMDELADALDARERDSTEVQN